MATLSVIIPTYAKPLTLEKVLDSLIAQEAARGEVEIIVAHDGSEDETARVVERAAQRAPFPVEYLFQSNRGVSAARNLGIRHARGEWVLLLGDDIVCTRSLIAEHLRWHARLPGSKNVVCGPVTWPPDYPVDRFAHWLDNGGPQFAYGKLCGQVEITFRNFYTCNASLRKQSLLEHRFDEEIRYGFEDIELGLRLSRHGYRFHFNPQALGFHYHPRTLQDFRRRQLMAGSSLYYAHRNNPEMRTELRLPKLGFRRRVKTLLRGLFLPILKWAGSWRSVERYWRAELDRALIKGYRSASRKSSA